MISERQPSRNYESAMVRAADRSTVIVIKALLYPLISVVTLLVCLLIWRESLVGHYFLIAVLAFICAADFLDLAPIHEWRNWRTGLRGLFDIVFRWMLVILFIWMLLRLSGLTEGFNKHVLVAWSLATPLALWLGQVGAQYFLLHSNTAQRHSRSAVIVGMTDLGLRLENTLSGDRLLRTEVLGYFEDRAEDRLPKDNHVKILGRSTDLSSYLLQNPVAVVYITLPMHGDPRIPLLLGSIRDSTVSIYFVPDLFAFNPIQARFDLVNGIPLIAVCESPFYGVRGLAKRLIDIVISGLGIVLILPLLLGLALAVRLTSPGPAIFKQRRYGLDGKPITVYKFRSMTVTEDGESSYTQVSRNDARVTPIGAFMRKTSLDELPQLLNVLDGSMSIVGPRPHAVAVNEQYRRLIPGYMVRHKVKPGITGWAQVNGYRGGDDLESMRKRIEFDLDYLDHWSLRFDLIILVKTMLMVWKDKQAY
jgi:putative colanic acid biosynthesis UDP-glucose lipid carrier transferase